MGFPLRHRQNGALKVLPKLWDGECRTMLGPVRVFPDHLLWLRVVSVMEVNIPVAETTVTLLFEKLGGLGARPGVARNC